MDSDSLTATRAAPQEDAVARPAKRFRVLVAGGGVAALETVLALHELAPKRLQVSVIAPNDELVYRPMTVREPFSYECAHRYALDPIVSAAGAELIADELAWVEADERVVHTVGGAALHYDALVLALGASALPRFAHAVTIDDRHLDDALHGLVEDVDGGYVKSVAFVAPARIAWPLSLYELAFMTVARAYDMGLELAATIVTPEDSPLAIFGAAASEAVAALLERARIETIHSAYAEVPRSGEVVINPGDRRLHVDRVVALPELYGPKVRGVPLSEHGFLRVNSHGEMLDAKRVFAAGDATEFPIKHGGLAAQQADAAAESIAALAGAAISPHPFHPVIQGMLLTGDEPLYVTAHITGGHGFDSSVAAKPAWSAPSKIVARYLAPCLAAIDDRARPAGTAS